MDKFNGMNDTERLDYLQSLTTGYGNGWILRESFHGRGIRLHETGKEGASPTVRGAIDNYLKVKIEERNQPFEFELLVQEEGIIEEGTWIPITRERIRNPNLIEKYINSGILRKISNGR
jgi:hypothetical protein